MLEYPLDIKPEIKIISKQKVSKIEKKLNLKIFKEYSVRNEKIDKIIQKDKDSKLRIIPRKVRDTARIHNQLFLSYFFKNLSNANIDINSLNYKNKNCIKFRKSEHNLNTTQKFDAINLSNTSQKIRSIIDNYDYCKREELLYNIRIKVLIMLINRLEIGGKFFTHLFDYCSLKTINFIYLLSLFFEKVVILKGVIVYCIGYLGENRVSKEILKSLINKNCEIDPMYKINDLIDYLKNNIKYRSNGLEDLLKKNYKKYIMDEFINYLNCIIEKDINNKYLYFIKNNFENIFLDIQYNNEKIYKLITTKKKDVCKTLTSLIKKESLNRILELGLGLGIFADTILKNKNKLLVSIDEQQEDIWKNYAIEKINKNLKKNKSNKFILYKNKIINSLEEIKQNYGSKYFDLIFIDKTDSFDKFIIELNIIKYLLRINGYIMFDNMFSLGFFKIIDYIEKNYKDLVRQKQYEGYVYKKIDEIELNNENYFSF